MTVIRYLGFALVSLLLAVPAQALDILLTNDDGYDHPWINAMREKLVAAGHEVTLVGPAVNQSGQSAALSLDALRSGDTAIRTLQPGIHAVDGTPATALILGATRVMDKRPDLVVSGINDGANIGMLSAFSGTVGATVAALNLVGEPIPAIAISGNRLDWNVEPGAEPNLSHAGHIADFLVKLVASLETNRGKDGALLPRGIALNINYPAVPRDQVKGAGIYRHGPVDRALFGGDASAPTAAATGTPGGNSVGTPAANPSEKEWDTAALAQGYITIVPINGDYTAPDWRHIVPAQRLGLPAR